MNAEPIEVLLVEDNPSDARLIREMLFEERGDSASVVRQTFALECVERLSAGLARLSSGDIDVVLLDLSLPDSHGLGTFSKMHAEVPQVPIILLTGLDDEELGVTAVREGAQDYLVKGQVDGNLLVRTIRYAIERKGAEERQNDLEEQLFQSQKLEAIGTLAAGIAHDFNNILTAMIGYAELLEMHPDMPAFARPDLGHIVEGGRRAAHLIRQILDFSRKSIIQLRPLDMMSFLKETTRFLQRTIPETIHIALEMDIGEYPINADSTQLQQMLTNLAVNARDAMPEGGELRFRLSRFILESDTSPPVSGMSPGEWTVLSVSDTGMGIPPEHLPHIYDPFFSTKEVGKGTGLGLAQVYGIVRQHDGFIDEESEVGKGTTFDIYLPTLGVRVKPPTKAVPEDLSCGRGELVLVAEDEPFVVDLIEKMLKRLGYRALTAGNGQEALRIYDQHREKIVLVLTDLIMPGMGGVELFHALSERNPDVKVALMTGYPLRSEGEKLLSQGLIAWVQKPMDLGKLTGVLKKAFA